MELISPTLPEPSNLESAQEPNQQPTQKIKKTNNPSLAPLKIENTALSEKTLTIESDLYIAGISTVGGGSIMSFQIKDHLAPDSNYVNLINQENKENLLLGFTNVDGRHAVLNNNWVLTSKADESYLYEGREFVFKTFFNGDEISKKLVFYPGSFVVDISINAVAMSKNIVGNKISLGWYGGLPSTEKDTIIDKQYFGAFLNQGGEILDLKASPGESFENQYKGTTDWVATRTKYFLAALFSGGQTQMNSAEVKAKNNNRESYDILSVFGADEEINTSLYLGPLQYDRVKKLGINLELVMNFGWSIIRPISKGVLWTLKSMHTYIPNYGVILIIFSILVKIIVYPLTKKSYQSTQAMQAIQPEINQLKEKHKNNPTKLNQATMDLYKKRGVNPLGGCLPMMLQMPLLFALFTVFRSTIELRGKPFVLWINDLSAPDIIFYLPFKIPIYGDYVCALPILMAVSMYAQQKMMAPSGGPQQEQQRMMQYFMMGFFFLIFNSFPSGLNLYYTLFNVLTIAQQKLIKTNQE